MKKKGRAAYRLVLVFFLLLLALGALLLIFGPKDGGGLFMGPRFTV